MGFEQLAALKRELELAAKAKADAQQQERRARKAPSRPPKAARRETPPVDPVVLTIARLQKEYPQAFPRKPADKVPLKLGVHKDLYELSATLKLSEDELKEAIKTWCQGSRYWACMVEGSIRVDLNGQPAGAVTAAEAQRARQLAWRARNEARKAAGGGKKAADTPAADTAAPAQAADQAAPDAEAAPAPAANAPQDSGEQTAQS